MNRSYRHSDRIYISYQGDPIEALEQARKQYGDEPAFILIPAEHWSRFHKKGNKHERQQYYRSSKTTLNHAVEEMEEAGRSFSRSTTLRSRG